MQQRIDAEQALTCERDPFGGSFGKETFLGNRRDLSWKTLQRIDPVLPREIRRNDRTSLQLQDEFANEPLPIG